MLQPMHDAPTANRSPCGSDQPGLKPFSSTRVSQTCPRPKRASASAPNVVIERVPVLNKPQTGPRFAVAQSQPVRDFFVAGASALAWVLLWVLLLFAAFFPRDDVSRDRTQVPQRSGEADCGGAMIEIDGRCVLGEDLEVRAPFGWRRQ
jgi:hypothetical protein